MNTHRIITTSWDDGHKLDLKLAELLMKYGIPGTFYISPNNHEFRKQNLLTSNEVKLMSKAFEIGAHTLSHPNLTKISAHRAKEEIIDSKRYLEKITGGKISAFCYPYGAYNAEVSQLVKDSGFDLARTTKRFTTRISEDNFALATTCHAYTHLLDLTTITTLTSFKTIAWEKIALKSFELVAKKGGIFHLWGHSWEIEKYNSWGKLEYLLQIISRRKDFSYRTNSKVIE